MCLAGLDEHMYRLPMCSGEKRSSTGCQGLPSYFLVVVQDDLVGDVTSSSEYSSREERPYYQL